MKMLLQLHYKTPIDDLHNMLNILKVDYIEVDILYFVNNCSLLDVSPDPVFASYGTYQGANC